MSSVSSADLKAQDKRWYTERWSFKPLEFNLSLLLGLTHQHQNLEPSLEAHRQPVQNSGTSHPLWDLDEFQKMGNKKPEMGIHYLSLACLGRRLHVKHKMRIKSATTEMGSRLLGRSLIHTRIFLPHWNEALKKHSVAANIIGSKVDLVVECVCYPQKFIRLAKVLTGPKTFLSPALHKSMGSRNTSSCWRSNSEEASFSSDCL